MINKITEALANKCINLDVEKIYTECIPEDVARPSLFIDFIRPTSRVLNETTREVNYNYQIIYIAPIDAYGNSKRSILWSMSEELLHTFSNGYILVENNKYLTEFTPGEIITDGITCDIVVKTFQPRVWSEQGEEIDDIGNVNITIRKE